MTETLQLDLHVVLPHAGGANDRWVADAIPLTILGVGIKLAVVVHKGSTLVVVTNTLRLLNQLRRSVLRQ